MFDLKGRRLFRTFVFTSFAIICFVQVYMIMESFLEYPYVINMLDVSPDLVTILPGVTICNNNRLSLRKLVKRNQDIREAMVKKFPLWVNDQKPIGAEGFNHFRDEVAIIFNKLNYGPQEEMDNATMNDLFEMKPDTRPYVNWIGCARSYVNSIECNMLSQIDSIQDRRCTTILHKGTIVYDQINRPHLFNSSQPMSKSRYDYFNAKEVVKLAIDFEPEDYADLKRQIGSRIIFHGNNYVASSSDPDFFVTRGFKYDFNIDREDLVQLESDRAGCVKWDQKNIDKFNSSINPRVPLYGETCFQNCIVRNIIHRSNCWPTTMPYYRNDTYDPTLKLKSCSWFREPPYINIYKELLRVEKLLEDIKNNVTTTTTTTTTTTLAPGEEISTGNREEMSAYMKIRRQCWSKCAQSCTLTKYSVTVTKSVWPSTVGTMFDKTA